jgi:hypothetical protein
VRRALPLLLLLLPTLAVAAPSPFESFDDAAPRVGARMPAVALKDEVGKAVTLPSGRPTVLVFGSFS